jgi:Protein of unknown function (DUF3096)
MRLVAHGSPSSLLRSLRPSGCQPEELHMMRIVAHLMPFAALAGGILILVKPPLLNYVVAVYLMLVGTIGLNHMYHFIR